MLAKLNESLGKGQKVQILILGVQLSLFLGKTFYCCSETLGCGIALTKSSFCELSVDDPTHMDHISL